MVRVFTNQYKKYYKRYPMDAAFFVRQGPPWFVSSLTNLNFSVALVCVFTDLSGSDKNYLHVLSVIRGTRTMEVAFLVGGDTNKG